MRTHRLDPVSLVFGVLFAAVALVGLTDAAVLTFADLRWVAPGVLVALGTVLVLTAARRDGDPADDAVDDRADEGAAV